MRSSFLDALPGSRIYPITDRRVSGLSHAEQVSQLIDRGATLVQLREKLLSPLEFYREVEKAMRIARDRRVKVIINDRVDIALAFGADGVHLGQDDLPPEEARRLLGKESIIGFSTHSLEQVELAVKMPIDYVAIGPIFETSTKPITDPPIGLEGLKQSRQITGNLPLVAIGGIALKDLPDALRMGADAAAIISDIWLSKAPVKLF